MYVLNVIQSAKYEQFRPVLDVYIKENFSATLAYKLVEQVGVIVLDLFNIIINPLVLFHLSRLAVI